MKKKFIFKSLGAFLCLLTTFSCKDDDSHSFKEEREIYMSNRVNLRIIFPAEKDTIYYTDTLSGFPIKIENDMFYMTTFIQDTITFHEETRDMKVVLTPTEFHITGTPEGERKYNLKGVATLYLNPHYRKHPIDTIPVKFIPSEGTIKAQKELFYYESQNIDLSKETEPYVTLRFKGTRIY